MWQRIAHIPDPTDATFNSYTMIDPAGLYIRSDRGGILFIYGCSEAPTLAPWHPASAIEAQQQRTRAG
jgi:hypothetical protein